MTTLALPCGTKPPQRPERTAPATQLLRAAQLAISWNLSGLLVLMASDSPISTNQISKILGCHPRTVERAFHDLKRRGLIINMQIKKGLNEFAVLGGAF